LIGLKTRHLSLPGLCGVLDWLRGEWDGIVINAIGSFILSDLELEWFAILLALTTPRR
jgi:hypothetical protein